MIYKSQSILIAVSLVIGALTACNGNQTENRFTRVDARDPLFHVSRTPLNEADVDMYGFGGALFDIDNDTKLDLFLGTVTTDSTNPCLFGNQSTSGNVSLKKKDQYCNFQPGSYSFAGGIDIENDGYHELVLLGKSRATLYRFHPVETATELFDQIPESDPRRQCTPNSFIAYDANLDGKLDIVIGCGTSTVASMDRDQVGENGERGPSQTWENIVFLQKNDNFEIENVKYSGLRGLGNTLGLAAIDLNEDGLLEVIVADDSFTLSAIGPNSDLPPGGIYFPCAGAEPCDSDSQLERFLPGDTAWGSYMGVGNLTINAHKKCIYLTNWGPNRCVDYLSNPKSDIARALEINRPGRNFSWGVVVDDFDLDGREDMLITEGDFHGETAFNHRDRLFMQTSEAKFSEITEKSGFGLQTLEDSRNSNWPFSSRGAAKADFDQDGRMEIMVLGMEGSPKFYSETNSNAKRCTLIPRNRYVASFGYGYAIAKSAQDTFFTRDIQGQIRLSTSPYVLSSFPKGVFRFPSGAVVPFDCAGATVLKVNEPAWVTFSLVGNALQVTFDEAVIGKVDVVSATLRTTQGLLRDIAAAKSGGVWTLNIQNDDQSVMFKIGNRWIARWFDIPNQG